MKKIEIYWQDLTEKAQRDILESLGEKEESHNWDTFPMAVVEIEDPDNIYVLDFCITHYFDRWPLVESAILRIVEEFPKELNYPNNGRKLTGGDILRLLDHKTDNELLSVPGIGKARLDFLRQLQWDIRREL